MSEDRNVSGMSGRAVKAWVLAIVATFAVMTVIPDEETVRVGWPCWSPFSSASCKKDLPDASRIKVWEGDAEKKKVNPLSAIPWSSKDDHLPKASQTPCLAHLE